jgi:signal transduction histidine kinase
VAQAVAQDEGLLHDARNLIGTIGLYCDLLSIPGVLKPEHRQYPDELRHLGERSGALIDGLMQSLLAGRKGDAGCPAAASCPNAGRDAAESGSSDGDLCSSIYPISLRSVLERHSGLLSRVADHGAIEIHFGPAAAAPVRISEEAVERILVNLVRNAAAALRDPASSSCDGGPGRISITLGLLANRVGEPKPWPFQRLRLSVEDSGCGMADHQVQSLLHGRAAARKDAHGIGFSVVRELVAATLGEIQVMSAPGYGTRVQIEWPVATASAAVFKAFEPGERRSSVPSRNGVPFTPESRVRSRRGADAEPASGMEGTC